MTTLNDPSFKKVSIAEIVRFGEKLVLPEGMSPDDAIQLLERRKEYDNAKVSMTESFDVFPYDGACALDTVLQARYGWAPAIPTGFFGQNPPTLMSVEVDYNKVRQVPWGAFKLPNITGKIETSFAQKEGRFVFAVAASVLRRDEQVIRELFADIRKECRENSIYRGKAIKIRFLDNGGNRLALPEPKFLDTDSIDETNLIFSRVLEQSIITNLFTPITRAADCIANGIAVKRGILLGGSYGTGKTLAATVASKLAVQHGVTYVYVPRADELADGIQFAKQYQSPACVVFCEDIDRVADGDRDVEMDDLLNTIDGIDSKTANVIVVLTTNNMEGINAAMLRPGRLDAVIEVTNPDAEAVERLIRKYSGATLDKKEDISKAAKVMEGRIPAVIAEVVKRAKLSQLALQAPGTKVERITGEALFDSASTMAAQCELMERAEKGFGEEVPELDQAFVAAVRRANGHDASVN